jgi:hypothetical protein
MIEIIIQTLFFGCHLSLCSCSFICSQYGLHGLFIESFVTLVFVGVVIEVNDQVVNCLGISPRLATTRVSPLVWLSSSI